MAFGFYLDANLTQPVNLNTSINIALNTAGGGAYVDIQLWFGSIDSSKKCQAASNPGVDQITITINDTNPAIHQPDATNGPYWVLALNQNDLNSNPQNNSIDIGTEVLGGVANARTFWLRIFEPEQAPAIWEDWILTTNAILEVNL
ncbi:conserved hypothetical protein [Hydrogenobacter thermophilus TK-6]|uniref:Uncharacterized protein n=1 Tax=Hydrogenobacter thermophilus (strain DSM 6534 / IAM 12695 / TK-6) TaxID=608538 RepID=D3DHQ1_HYDTT|nr:hypothetical protein [Hydrogenobacter thermophilus]ADO45290.1 conserved hypothetical protein [Hydrogenobacter thermophilus TK-6]BAI69353.1 hypothetical protein HTH_0894 [Hydrogenobacter thermophilus TK-6]